MSKKLMILAIFASFLLTACNSSENTTKDEKTQNNALNIDETNHQDLPNEVDMTYDEYVEEYKDVDPTIPKQEENNLQMNESESNDENNFEISQNTPNDESNLLATYSTSLKSSSDERVNNIEIVCGRLNDYILKPQETFSYNDVTGPFGPDDGFEEAPILLSNGEEAEGYGGGVCQLSSTLYNVVKDIPNIEITERHHHSSPVTYVPEGQDATVSLQSNLDFKFTNNNNYSIKFKAECSNR